jgi:hypothetical protein
LYVDLLKSGPVKRDNSVDAVVSGCTDALQVLFATAVADASHAGAVTSDVVASLAFTTRRTL